MEKRHGGFWKGLLIFGVGTAVGYLAAKSLKIELTEDDEDDWDIDPEEDDGAAKEPKAPEKAAGKPDGADPALEELKF